MLRDLQLAARRLAKDRLFSLAVIMLLAVGIGAITALFGLVDALLLRPLPVRDPERLVRLITIRPPLPPSSEFFEETYHALRKSATGLADLLAWSEQDQFVRAGEATERLRIHLVSGNFFEALGTQPALGRLLTHADERTGDALPAVLGYQYWQRRFRGDRAVLGLPITIEGRAFTIAGVTPKGFNGLTVETGPDLCIPMSAAKLWPQHLYGGRVECAIAGRLKQGVPLESARAEADAIRLAVERQAAANTLTGPEGRFELEPAWRGVSRMRTQFSVVLGMLLAGLGLLLLMICANVAGLVLARIASRQSELAVRVALGATRGSLVRQLLAESLILMAGGAAGAFAISAMLIPQLTAALPPVRDLTATRLPLTLEVNFDWRVFTFGLAACGLATLLLGLMPALASSRRDIHPLLKEARAGSGWRGRQLLVVAQSAVATLLLAVAALTLLTIGRLNQMDPGFQRDGIVTFSVDPAMAGYNDQQALNLRTRLMNEARQLPATMAVALASRGLMRGTGRKMTVARTGETAPPAEFLNVSTNSVSPEYFTTLGLPLLAGQLLSEAEQATPNAPANRVVNQAFVRKFFPDRDPIGQTFGGVQVGKGAAKPHYVIQGVVGDARYRSLREPIQPIVYDLFSGSFSFILHMRSHAPPATIIPAMRAKLTRIDPRLAFIEATALKSEVDASLWAERVAAFVATALASAAILIAACGIYALLAFAVQQRRREIGIRAALGAQRHDIVWLFGGRALALAAIGAGIGLMLIWLAAPLFKAILYEVEPFNTVAIAGAIACVLFFAAAGALAPSLRAAATQPTQVLREQ